MAMVPINVARYDFTKLLQCALKICQWSLGDAMKARNSSSSRSARLARSRTGRSSSSKCPFFAASFRIFVAQWNEYRENKVSVRIPSTCEPSKYTCGRRGMKTVPKMASIVQQTCPPMRETPEPKCLSCCLLSKTVDWAQIKTKNRTNRRLQWP